MIYDKNGHINKDIKNLSIKLKLVLNNTIMHKNMSLVLISNHSELIKTQIKHLFSIQIKLDTNLLYI